MFPAKAGSDSVWIPVAARSTIGNLGIETLRNNAANITLNEPTYPFLASTPCGQHSVPEIAAFGLIQSVDVLHQPLVI
jgi:hypothetical protein